MIATEAEDHRPALLERLTDVENCGPECRWEVADTLGKPGNERFLLTAFEMAKSGGEKLGIIYALYRIDDAKVESFFKQLMVEKYDDGEELYYPLNYLAKRCNPDALRILSGDGRGGYGGYPGCMQWGTTVELFGKCKYKPAIPYLIDSVTAACLNIGYAAINDLRTMYPDSPDFKGYSLEKIQQYFQQRAAADRRQKGQLAKHPRTIQ